MKLLSFILALTILSLSWAPCSDGQNAEDLQQVELGADHDHQEDTDDTCPMSCFCNCCGMTITFQSISTFDLDPHLKISTHIIANYQSDYRFDFHFSIWQPPRLIS